MKKNGLWTGLASLFSFLLCFAIIGTSCAFDYAGTINGTLGIATSKIVESDDAEAEDTEYYKSDYGEKTGDTLKELISDTFDQNVAEEEEGAVLLKNDNNTLPLTSDETSVTLFGHSVVQPLYRADSAGSTAYEGEEGVDLHSALQTAGFAINDTLYKAYESSSTHRQVGGYNMMTEETTDWKFGEEDISFYTDDLKNSWSETYNDVAIVMLTREGGEGSEIYMEDSEEGISQLALHQSEKDMLKMIQDSGKFSKTVVLINSGNAMELGWLNEEEYGVDACMWIGCPGEKGFTGVANLLTGDANPSGHLTDTYAANSLSAPACVNNSYNNQTWTNLDDVLDKTTEGDSDVSYYAVQAEGIYVGYKYYETRYEDSVLGQANADGTAGSSDGQGWNYTNEVTFPFGYGLSYSSFNQTLESVDVSDDTVSVTVAVTNTGSVAGKSVVQVYAQTPYGDYEKENQVEKSAIQLLDFGKTKELAPGESETVTIDCDKYLLASYDYVGAQGYILSEGDYYISIGDNSHDALNNVLAEKGATNMVAVTGDDSSGNADKTYKWQQSFDDTTYRYADDTDVEVTNQFDDCDANYWLDDAVTYLSRSDWEGTYPVEATQLEMTDEMLEAIDGGYYKKSEDATLVSDYVQGDNQGITLATMHGVDYDDDLWDTFINQMTIEEMASLLQCNFGTAEITSIGKPQTVIGDGPDGVGGMGVAFSEDEYGFTAETCCYTSEVVLASTYNKDLMESRGSLMGEEGLYLGYMENWSPGINIHRTPFGGRNFEYYSEDSNMSYLCSIPTVEAMQEKGVNAGPKHVVGNDQENNRKGISCFFNEQAFREGDLRGAEGAISEADSGTLMQGFNRLGLTWCSSSTALCTQVIRNEWGFTGHEETDAIAMQEPYVSHYADSLMAGTDTYCLDFTGVTSNAIVKQINDTDDGDLLASLRRAAKNYLYTTANSCSINGFSSNASVESITPWWQPTLYALIAVFVLLDILSLVMMTRRKIKNKRAAAVGKDEGEQL